MMSHEDQHVQGPQHPPHVDSSQMNLPVKNGRALAAAEPASESAGPAAEAGIGAIEPASALAAAEPASESVGPASEAGVGTAEPASEFLVASSSSSSTHADAAPTEAATGVDAQGSTEFGNWCGELDLSDNGYVPVTHTHPAGQIGCVSKRNLLSPVS